MGIHPSSVPVPRHISTPPPIEELAEVFAIRPEEEPLPTFNADWRPERAEESVLSACSTLVTLVDIGGYRIVQFSHSSVKEYLTSNRIANSEHVFHFRILPTPSHILLARACLGVLLQSDYRMLKECPLTSYAAQHWVDHAKFENVSSEIQDVIECLFDSDKPHFAAWIWVYNIDRNYSGHSARPKPPEAVPLYYAALCDFYHIAERLIDANPGSVDARGGFHMTPLHAAVAKGHLNITLLLLEHGADVGYHGRGDQTPLHVSSRHGYVEIARSLIDRGADPNAKMYWDETPLYTASEHGMLEVARVLLDLGADVNQGRQVCWTPLHIASCHGHDHVVKLLLNRGANVNAEAMNSRYPLHVASDRGHTAVVMALLQNGASVNVRDGRSATPLHDGTRPGHLETVRLLLEHGADVNAQDDLRWAPSHLAASRGSLQIMELLLKHGANLHAENNEGKTPLQVASGKNHLQIMQLLSERAEGVV